MTIRESEDERRAVYYGMNKTYGKMGMSNKTNMVIRTTEEYKSDERKIKVGMFLMYAVGFIAGILVSWFYSA